MYKRTAGLVLLAAVMAGCGDSPTKASSRSGPGWKVLTQSEAPFDSTLNPKCPPLD